MLAIIIIVLTLLITAAAAVFAPRFGLPAPLILVVVGIAVSFLPAVPALVIEPEWILSGVLPPLLYSTAVSMPSMSLRRDFGAVGALSVVLVVLTSLVLGLFFTWAIPGVSFAWGVALGAIISPTDAVATRIVKNAGAAPRVVALLEGEGLLNDASALVVLRTAIAATAVAFSFWSAVGTFIYAVGLAAVIGAVVGRVNVWLRSRVTDATVNTLLSFTAPFLASIPAEELGASGLVAAVLAGLVTGLRAPRELGPQHRLSDRQNWATAELMLEGVIFLTMGLQLYGLVEEVHADHQGIGTAVGLALGALIITVLVRSGFVIPLLAALRTRAARSAAVAPRLSAIEKALADPDWAQKFMIRQREAWERHQSGGGLDAQGVPLPGQALPVFGPQRPPQSAEQVARGHIERAVFLDPQHPDAEERAALVRRAADEGRPVFGAPGRRPRKTLRFWWAVLANRRHRRGSRNRQEELSRFGTRLRRMLADIDYFRRSPLGKREAVIVVWAGMRGAVTVAAAQTLPTNTPGRALLVVVAFMVAAISLLVQGGTIGWVARRVARDDQDADRHEAEAAQEHGELLTLLDEAVRAAEEADPEMTPVRRLQAERTALLDARDDGAFDPETLDGALAAVDAEQISIELRGEI